jgi:hypothetical protein
VAGLTADGWGRLFEELDLQAQLDATGMAALSAEQIKQISKRAPRLMTKFDTRESRPSRLADLTVLPLTNGTYVLVRGDGYGDVPDATQLKRWTARSMPRSLLTLPWQGGPSSESQALDMAAATGLLEDFLGESDVRLTVRGRLRAPRFEFQFRGEQGRIANCIRALTCITERRRAHAYTAMPIRSASGEASPIATVIRSVASWPRTRS